MSNQPASVKDALTELMDAADPETLKSLILAEQTAIAFFYDTMSALTAARISGEKTRAPDTGPMQKAVQIINDVCEKQQKPRLFQGDAGDLNGLFQFAGAAAVS